MSKTLIFAPGSGPLFSDTMELSRAVLYNVNERTNGPRTDALALMFSNLLSELIDYGALLPESVGRILAMSVTDIQDVEKMPPFQEDLL